MILRLFYFATSLVLSQGSGYIPPFLYLVCVWNLTHKNASYPLPHTTGTATKVLELYVKCKTNLLRQVYDSAARCKQVLWQGSQWNFPYSIETSVRKF
jgi:hypothetical protein